MHLFIVDGVGSVVASLTQETWESEVGGGGLQVTNRPLLSLGGPSS